MPGDMTPTQFIENLRKTRDPNLSDIEYLLQLVWIGEVIAKPKKAAKDDLEEAKFYHCDWPLKELLKARHDGLIVDAGEAWRYMFTGNDGTLGKYDLLVRRKTKADRAATNAIGNMRHAFEIADAEYERDTRARTMGGPDE